MQIRPRATLTQSIPGLAGAEAALESGRERKLTFVCSLSVQRVPAYKLKLYAGKALLRAARYR